MSHKYRLAPTESHTAHLFAHCSDAATVFNALVEQNEFCYRYRWPSRRWNDEKPVRDAAWAAFPTSSDIAAARAGSFLGTGSSSVHQQAARDYIAAIRRWHKASETARLKGRPEPGRPGYRRKKDGQGFVVRDVKVQKLNRHYSQIQIPKHDDHGRAVWVKFSLSRPLPAKYTTARITLDRDGRWHVSFTAPPAPISRDQTGAVVGIDRGVANSIATSDGTFDHAPTLTKGEHAWHLEVQRRFSGAATGSDERVKWKGCRARSYAKLKDRRNDWVEKTTTQLVRDYDIIVIERLNIVGMTRSAKGTVEEPGRNVAAKSGLNRAILAQCWGRFAVTSQV